MKLPFSFNKLYPNQALGKLFKKARIKQAFNHLKKFKKSVFYAGLCCGLFALGLMFGLNSWNKNLYVQWSPSTSRGLAGVNDESQILNLSSEQLSGDIRETLFFNSQTGYEEDMLFFYLGNFLTYTSEEEEYRFICQAFPLVEFSFSALGLSLSGDAGLMVIQAPCNMEDEEFIGPFWIPYKEILAHAEAREFELPEQETFIRFYNASPILTPQWVLQTVRFFYDEGDDNELVVSHPTGKDYFNIRLKETVREPVEPVITKTVF